MSRDPTAPNLAQKWTVLYDADCGFCRWALAQVLAFDRDERLHPVALQSREADELLADMAMEQRLASWHLVSANGERSSGGAAAPALLALLRAGKLPAAGLARAPRLTDRAYRWVAEHRSQLSRLVPRSAKQRADARIAQAQRRRT